MGIFIIFFSLGSYCKNPKPFHKKRKTKSPVQEKAVGVKGGRGGRVGCYFVSLELFYAA